MTEKKPKILVADPSTHIIEIIQEAKDALNYEIITVNNGNDCLEKLSSFQPDFLLLDLMLPYVHGIEIVKKIRSSESLRHIGVIILSYNLMIQNYHAAIEAGANSFLIKPFDPNYLFTLIDKFFAGRLTPDPFIIQEEKIASQKECYIPMQDTHKSYIKFWGTRGSNAVAGADYIRYGGNTCSLEFRFEDSFIVLDAGTGIRELGEQIAKSNETDVNLFIGHTHWDHITGFPFFAPIYQKNCNVTVWAPVGFEKNAKELFTDMLAYSYFPVRLDEMNSKVQFQELRDGLPTTIGKISIESHYTNHPGPTFCFKLKVPGMTIGYVTDNEMLLGYMGHPKDIGLDHPLLEPHLSLIEFLKGSDIIVHEAQYLQNEYTKKVGWGHSSISNAAVLIKHTKCPHWIVTHHDPEHVDTMLEEKLLMHKNILKDCNIEAEVTMAYDGLLIPL